MLINDWRGHSSSMKRFKNHNEPTVARWSMRAITPASITALAFSFALSFVISLGFNQAARADQVAQTADTDPSAEEKTAESSLPLDELRLFATVYGKIKSDYVEAVDDKKMLKDAINGILAGLDPHSSFLSGEDFKELQVDTRGEFGGLGIEITTEKGFVRVVTPIDDTPAYRAGVKAGDIITHIDREDLRGQPLGEAVKKMRGKPGSRTILTIVREDEEKPLKIEVERDVISLVSVKSRDLGDSNYAYLRITSFDLNTASKLEKAIRKAKKAAGGQLKGAILDLRNNPGGLLNAAIDVSDIFLAHDAGKIVDTHGRQADAEASYSADSPDLLGGAPMIVLVNNGSASASEIVAGALQDHQRAIVMGTQTFGKGSVQSIITIDGDSALKITTGRYYTPSGRSIQETGIQPDIIAALEDRVKRKQGEQRREVDLQGHLVNEQAAKPEKTGEAAGDWWEKDSQVRDALNLLKGITIANTRHSENG